MKAAKNAKYAEYSIQYASLARFTLVFMLTLTFGFVTMRSYSQRVGVNTTGALPNPSALLDIDAAPGNNMGLLIPRVPLQSTTDVVTIPIPATSLLVYNNNAAMTGGALGFWYWDGAQWVQLGAGGGGGNAWLILGNAGTIDGTNFLGTTDNVPLSFRVNNQKAGRIENDVATANTFLGYHAGNALTTGTNNTATGYQALQSNISGHYNTAMGVDALYSNTLGVHNTANGAGALYSNMSGVSNTASGSNTLYSNTTGSSNTAIGQGALQANTDGYSNAATGSAALYENITGSNNTATGFSALRKNTSGYSNVAIGVQALYSNTDRSNLVAIGDSALFNNGLGTTSPIHATGNTAVGSKALYSNTTGYVNTATGAYALYRNTTGISNTACGIYALVNNTTGDNNTTCGMNTLTSNNTGSSNTAMGEGALSNNATGDYNTAIGRTAFITGAASAFSNSTALGANAVMNASNKVRIGDATVTVIQGQVAYTFPSDGRFKNNVTEEVKGLDFIDRLRPIVYNFDTEKFDKFLMQTASDSLREAIMSKKDYSESSSIRQSGFIAQEVEQAAKESGYNFNGVYKPENENDNYSIAYALLTVPLVKSVQELNARNQSLELVNQKLKAEIEILKTSNAQLQTSNLDYGIRLKKLEEILGLPAEVSTKTVSPQSREIK